MKILLAIILTTIITGCVSTPDRIDYYQDLPPQQAQRDEANADIESLNRNNMDATWM